MIDGQGVQRMLPLSAEEDLTVAQRQILEYNRRTQRQNNAPPDFPSFLREGYDMTILASEGYQARRRRPFHFQTCQTNLPSPQLPPNPAISAVRLVR